MFLHCLNYDSLAAVFVGHFDSSNGWSPKGELTLFLWFASSVCQKHSSKKVLLGPAHRS